MAVPSGTPSRRQSKVLVRIIRCSYRRLRNISHVDFHSITWYYSIFVVRYSSEHGLLIYNKTMSWTTHDWECFSMFIVNTTFKDITKYWFGRFWGMVSDIDWSWLIQTTSLTAPRNRCDFKWESSPFDLSSGSCITASSDFMDVGRFGQIP